MRARKLFVLALACMASVMAHGKAFSLDLRVPSMGGRVARAKLAAPQTDSGDGAIRRVNLDAGVADVGEVAVGDELSFTLFDDVAITLTLKKQMPSLLGGEVFLAEASDYDGVKNAVVLRTAEGLTVDIQDYRNGKVYKVISTATGVAVQELEAKGGRCGCDVLGKPDRDRDVSANVRKAKKAVANKAPDPDGICVDILVAYDKGAMTWANDYGGGITNFAQMAVNKMNGVLANNSLDDVFHFRLLGIETVSASSRNLNYALNLVTDGVGDWAPIKAKREKLGADIVTVLIDTGSAYGTTGLGWSLESYNIEYFSDNAYNACSIRSVAQWHTMTHEVGHNMGCGHSDTQSSQPGPQLYDYSSGYYFVADYRKYHTIMAYDNDGPGGTEVPYFSSPSNAYKGVTVGDEKHNNRLTLYNTCGMVSKWRTAKEDEIDDGGDDDPAESISSDDFANARKLTGASGDASFSNDGYTKEPGEPEHSSEGWDGGASAWATWTAPETGDWTFWLTGTLASNADEELDTQLAIYTGTAVGSLTRVAANDDTPAGGHSSRVSFHATKGVEYKIAMDTYEGAVGSMNLRWENRYVHYVEFEYDTIFVPASGDEAEIAMSSSTEWNVVDYPDWVVPSVLSGTNGAMMAFSVKPNSTGAERTGTISVQAGNSEQKSFTIRQHVVDFVTTKDAAVEAALRMNRRILLVMGRETCGNTEATLFNSIPSSTVWPLLDADRGYVLWYSNCDRQSDAYGYASGLDSYTLPLVCIIDPQDMSKYVDRVTGYQSESDLESLLEANAVLDDFEYVTVTFNANGGSGTMAAQTITRGESLALGKNVFTRAGYAFIGWATLPDGEVVFADEESIEVLADMELYAVWTLIDDNFVNARRLTGASGTASFNNTRYTTESGEPKHSSEGWDGGASAWASWTAPDTGDWTFWLMDACTSDIDEELDTQLAIYTGTSVGRLTLVAANDDTPAGGYSSRVSFHVTKGVEYKIAMDGYRGTTGLMTLKWEPGFIHSVQFEYDTMFAPATGGGASIGVSSSTGWNVVECSEWITPSAMSGAKGAGLVFSMSPNTTGLEREGTLTIQAGNSEPATLSIRQHVVDFVTTKDAAVEAALRMNRRILLVMGRELCGNTRATLFESIPSSTVLPLWDTNLGYVLWYSNRDRQSDAYGYASGLGYYMPPLVCIIDPQNMSKYVDRVTGYQDEDALKSFLDRNKGWPGLPEPATYTVTYNPGANGTGARQTATKEEDVALVLKGAIFNRTGYTQSGWATSDGGAKAYAISASYTANAALTLYPVWTANNYKVTFNAQGGSLSTTTKTVTYNSSYGVLPRPTLAGYTFEGWYTAANGGTLITASSKVAMAANHTLYAKWKPLPSISSYAGTLDTEFARALTVDGALYKNGVIAGTMQVKVGKISKKGVVKVSAAATLLIDGRAKKVTAKAVNVVLDVVGRIPPVAFVFKGPIGNMTFAMEADGLFTLNNGLYMMKEAKVGGALKGGAEGMFRMDGFNLAVPCILLEHLLPKNETFSVSGGKWKFDKAAMVKWAKPKKGAEHSEYYDATSGKDLIVDTSKGKSNLSGLKLIYTAKTGQFKGSFKVYALQGTGKKRKLAKYTVNVIGFVVDGVGYGEVSCKKPAASWSVTVK